MANVDLGKQYGPLPLGAWLAVVGIGGGIAWYTRRQGQNAPVTVTDTSGVPGVGEGGSGSYTQLTPVVSGTTPPASNEEWGRKMVQWLIGMGYDPVTSQSAVTKYINAGKLSVQEYTLVTLAMAVVGPPPQGVPYIPDDDTDTTPPPTSDPDYFHVWEGAHYSTIIGLATAAHPSYDLSESKLAALNPGWPDRYLAWSKPGVGWVAAGTPGAERTFGSSFNLRIR